MYFTREPLTVLSVVGSCVVVCLWDRSLKYGGMCHFLYPKVTRGAMSTPKYGNVATPHLVELMKQAGCRNEDLKAHIFGGGSPEGLGATDYGWRNVGVARATLKQKGISIVSEDVGGHMGRKIVFDVATGHVAVLKVHDIRQSDWASTSGE